jgi:hypothetical protein
MLLPIEASLLSLLLGPSRLTALTVNFLHFALLQVALVWVLRATGKRWSVAFLAVGLLLTAAAPFRWAGGIMDFRLDFSALCVFGIFACVLVRTDLFAHRGWSVAAGLAGAWCILARFPTALYVSGILLLLFALVCVRWLVYRRLPECLSGRRVLNSFLAGIVCIAVFLPGVYARRHGIYSHYIEHVKRDEHKVRQQEFGIKSRVDQLLYYPRSLARDHIGRTWLLLAAFTLASAVLLGLLFWKRGAAPALSDIALRLLAPAVLCALWPLVALTSYPSPSPIVASIVVAPLVLVTVLLAAWLSRSMQWGAKAWPATVLLGLAAVVLGAGLLSQASAFSARGPVARLRSDVDQVVALYDFLYQHSRDSDWEQPRVAIDYLSDSLNLQAVTTVIYERHGVAFTPRPMMPFDPMFEPDEQTALDLVSKSDIVILNTRPFPNDSSIYPYNRCLARHRPCLIAYCDRERLKLRTFRFFGGEVTVYARPSLAIQGDSEGWVTSAGMSLKGSTNVLRRWPIVELSGANTGQKYLGRLPRVKAELLLPNRDPRPVDAVLTSSNDQYRLLLRAPTDVPPDTPAELRLSFDCFFVPARIGMNPDRRELVIQTPSSISCKAAPAPAEQQ